MRAAQMRRMMRRSLSVLMAAMLVASLAAPAVSMAAPSNAKITAARAEARKAQEHIDDLAADLEERSEEQAVAEEQLAQTQRRMDVTASDITAAQARVSAAQARLNGRVSAIYRNGQIDPIALLIGSASFDDLVSRVELLTRIEQSDANLLGDLEKARSDLQTAYESLEARKTEQVALVAQVREKRQEVQQALRSQRSYLANLDRKLDKLIAEERERQERLARERAAEAARRAAAAAKAIKRTTSTGQLPQAHSQIVTIARRYVGKTPYVWGGTTPSGFDCSGLTQYCYREIGVSIPRTSRQQYRVGSFIAPDRLDLLREGDLVFFGRNGDPNRVHHVGIYSGSGRFIHAPQTGMRVSESSLQARILSRGDYVGAIRP